MNDLLILFLFAITLHNLEEALWLPSWSKELSKPSFHQPVEKSEFHFMVLIITALTYLSVFFHLYFPNSIVTKFILIGFLGSMIFNIIFPHLLATIIFKKYAPGVATGILLVVPINSFILFDFFHKNELSWLILLLSTAVVGVILLTIIPILFKIGKTLTKSY